MSGATYVRARRVLWRLAHDRVLIRKVGDHSTAVDAELTGPAAVVWLVLDEPQTTAGLRSALEVAGCAKPGVELELVLSMLREHGLIAEKLP